jgi:hypothetical protein
MQRCGDYHDRPVDKAAAPLRRIGGVIVLLWAISMVVWVAYNLLVERQPEFNVPPFVPEPFYRAR